jgi:hypothetical protein
LSFKKNHNHFLANHFLFCLIGGDFDFEELLDIDDELDSDDDDTEELDLDELDEPDEDDEYLIFFDRECLIGDLDTFSFVFEDRFSVDLDLNSFFLVSASFLFGIAIRSLDLDLVVLRFLSRSLLLVKYFSETL